MQITDRQKRVATVSALACAIAMPAEGLRQWAYHDPVGILTTCYGHTGADVQKGVKYSIEQCDALLTADMQKAISTVDKCQPGLPDNVLAAFSDAAYNLGPTIACNTERSTAARYLAAGMFQEACDQLPRWNKASVGGVMVPLPGLTKRRAKERELCLA